MLNIDVPPGSVVVVTGVNGYIGSHIAEEFLQRGYDVRGTVRDVQRCAWIADLFDARYGPGRFTLVPVPDLGDEAAYGPALRGASSLVITTTAADFQQTDPDAYIPVAVRQIQAPLEAAARNNKEQQTMPNDDSSSGTSATTIKSVVLTGSAWAVNTPAPDDPALLDQWTWNEAAVATAYAPAFSDARTRGAAIFMAGMVQKERGAWDWVREHRPSFRFSVLLVASVFGAVVDCAHQGTPTSAGFVALLMKGDGGSAARARGFIRPQWFVDAEDVGRLHVAAAVKRDVAGERIFAYAQRFGSNDVLEVLRRRFPKRQFAEDDGAEGKCVSNVMNQRGEGLLREMGREGWTDLDTSVNRLVESALPVLSAA